jgi:hypothetical protein
MKIIYTKEILTILESLQIHAENINSGFLPKNMLDDKQLVENICHNSSMLAKARPGLDSTVNFYKSYQGKLPTKYEDPIDYPKLVLIFEKVVEAAVSLGYKLPETISIGTVCSGQLNAHIITAGDKKLDNLLVFNRQIFLFNDLFARYIAWLISNEVKNYSGKQTLMPRKPSESEIKKLDELIYYLINKIEFHRDSTGGVELVIALDKTNAKMPIMETDEVGNIFKEMMLVPMASFVIAHELMHIHLKHKKSIGEPINVDTSFDEELFCDTQGVLIAAQTAANLYKGSYPQGWQKFATVGSVLFLSCLDITQKAAYVLQNGTMPPHVMEEIDINVLENNKYDSYPTTLFRLQMVYSKLRLEVERASAPNSGDWVFENSNWIDTFFVESWKEMKGFYLSRYSSRKKMYDLFQNDLKGRYSPDSHQM